MKADVKTAILSAHTRVAAGNTGSEQKKVIWKLQKSLWSEKRTETLAGPSGADPQEVRFRPERAGHLPANSHDEASITRIPRGRFVVGWNAPDHQRNPH